MTAINNKLLPCPFCGEVPRMTSRPDNAQGTVFFAAVACDCGGYSACAHKMAIASTQADADALACAAWNSRKLPPNAGDEGCASIPLDQPVLPKQTTGEMK